MNFNQKFEDICQKRGLVGASVVIVKEDEIDKMANYGYMSLEKQKLVSSDTIFRIASISKIIVAIAVMSLVELNKVSIDDDISDIFGFKIRNPHHPDKKITIKMLMTQTSSITDGYDDENPANDNEIRGYNGVNLTSLNVKLEELLVPNKGKYYTDLTWDKEEPGTKFIYSNFGCGILACIVEALSNELFTTYVEKRIFKPLSIDASFRASNIINQDAIADLYYRTNAQETPYKVSRTAESFLKTYPIFDLKENFRGPAGGLFISMKDLSKIMRVLMNDGVYKETVILNKSTIDLMLQLHMIISNDYEYKAKGLQLRFIDNFNGLLFKGHTGSAYGVISYLFFNKEEQLGICFITNGGYYGRGSLGMYDVQEEVFNEFLKEYWPQEEKKLEFSFNVYNDYGVVDNRTILFEHKPIFDNDEIYIPLKALASGLNIIPKIINNKIVISKKDRAIDLEINYHQDLIIVPIKAISKALEMDLYSSNEEIIIRY